MPVPSTNQQLILPVQGDLNDVPTHLGLYNDGVESRLVQRFASAVDRSVRNPTPQEGELSFLADTDVYEWFNGTSWLTLVPAGAWSTYTPIFGAVSGPAPNIGNGTVAGRYQQIGKTVNFAVTVTLGSSSSVGGTNQWTLSLPVPGVLTSTIRQIVPGRVFDSSPANAYIAVAHIAGAYIQLEAQSSVSPALGTDAMRQGFPITFASGDLIHYTGVYEAA